MKQKIENALLVIALVTVMYLLVWSFLQVYDVHIVIGY